MKNNGTTSQRSERNAISWELQLLLFFVAAALVISRRPDALFNAQFFGEDVIWYPEAYINGFRALLHSQNGYFQTLPRLVAELALLVPLRFAPLLMNLIGMTFQVLPVNILMSERCARWGPLYLRGLLAVIYIALPNTSEVDVAIEEAQWHLALIACLLALATPAKKVGWQIFDICILLLAGLTGPFAIFLLPITLIFWWSRRDSWRLVESGVLAVGALIQSIAIIQSASETRPKVGLGATPKLFVKLIAGRVYLAGLLGRDSISKYHPTSLTLIVLTIFGTAVLAYCLIKASMEWKLFLAFCIAVFTASLRAPMVSMTVPQWQILSLSPGIRYWFFPTLAFAWALVWCATSPLVKPIQLVSGMALLTMAFGIVIDWRYPAYTDFHFAEYARRFSVADIGTHIRIPVYPDGWTMELVKKLPGCNTSPAGWIDEPKAGARISGRMHVVGWVRASEQIRLVTVYVDHVAMKSTVPGIARPDVDRDYPASRNKLKGWEISLDPSQVPPGTHEMTVRAVEADGCYADIGSVPIEAGTRDPATR